MTKHIYKPRKTWYCFACSHDIRPKEDAQIFRTCMTYPLRGTRRFRFRREMHIDCVSPENLCCKAAIAQLKKALRAANLAQTRWDWYQTSP